MYEAAARTARYNTSEEDGYSSRLILRRYATARIAQLIYASNRSFAGTRRRRYIVRAFRDHECLFTRLVSHMTFVKFPHTPHWAYIYIATVMRARVPVPRSSRNAPGCVTRAAGTTSSYCVLRNWRRERCDPRRIPRCSMYAYVFSGRRGRKKSRTERRTAAPPSPPAFPAIDVQ